jgi:hypothetical protein
MVNAVVKRQLTPEERAENAQRICGIEKNVSDGTKTNAPIRPYTEISAKFTHRAESALGIR